MNMNPYCLGRFISSIVCSYNVGSIFLVSHFFLTCGDHMRRRIQTVNVCASFYKRNEEKPCTAHGFKYWLRLTGLPPAI